VTESKTDQTSPHPQPFGESLDLARLKFERQKFALEMRLKRRELSDQRGQSVWRTLFANPLSVAIVGGILTLMTSVVTSFLTARANLEDEQSRAGLARQSAQQTLQADLIKKFVEGPRPESVRENLRFLADTGLIPDYAVSIQHYLVTNPGVAPQVGSRLDFSPAGEALSADQQQRLRNTVGEFRTFLQIKGFNRIDDNISVFIFSKDHPLPITSMPSDQPNSFYYENTLYIHKTLADDSSIALREFAHYALLKAVGSELFKQTGIESALADYLPATFLKSPVIGSAFAKENGASRGPRTLDNKQSYNAAATKGEGGWFDRGIVWAGAIWACRNPQQPDGVDNLILALWRKASVLPLEEDLVEVRFGAALAAAAAPQGVCFAAQIAARGLPILRPYTEP
jgi:hypothetical protein